MSYLLIVTHRCPALAEQYLCYIYPPFFLDDASHFQPEKRQRCNSSEPTVLGPSHAELLPNCLHNPEIVTAHSHAQPSLNDPTINKSDLSASLLNLTGN